MTNLEINCDICDDYITTLPFYNEDESAFVDDDGVAYETLGDFLNENENAGLWNTERDIYVCMGCVTLAYEVANGAPIRKRIRQTIHDWRWRWYKWRHRKDRRETCLHNPRWILPHCQHYKLKEEEQTWE